MKNITQKLKKVIQLHNTAVQSSLQCLGSAWFSNLWDDGRDGIDCGISMKALRLNRA